MPNATIVVLDYKNIGEFLDVRELGLNLFSGKLMLMHIADAIRVALLAKHGGIWLDADTIVLSPNAEKYFQPDEKHRTVIFGNLKNKICHIAFINTPPNAVCMNLWREFIKEKIWNLKPSTPVNWDFFGNTFINDYAKKYPHEIEIIDHVEVTPEINTPFMPDNRQNAYIDFFFRKNLHLADIKADMMLLHNSWTPAAFKQLSPGDFFRIDCTMTNVLAEALNLPVPPPRSRIRLNGEK